MEIKELKSSLFGFKKNTVYEYIANLNKTCSDKVEKVKAEKKAAVSELSKKNEDLNEKNAVLENQISVLNREISEKDKLIATLKEDTDERKIAEREVADILLEAKKFGETLRQKANEENMKMREENRQANQREQERIEKYSAEISEVKKLIRSILKDTHEKLTQAESEISELKRKSYE